MEDHGGFYEWGERSIVDVPRLGPVEAPGMYAPHRVMAGVFTADLDEVRGRLPSDELHPVRWGRGRAALIVFGTYYTCVFTPSGRGAWGFGEAGVFAVLTHGAHDAPPYVPLLGLPVPESMHTGSFALHVPITNRYAHDLGRLGYGIPKFMADIRYEERGGHDRVVVEEGGRLVFAVRASTGGRPRVVDEVGLYYSDLDGDLLRYQLREAGTRVQDRGDGCASLELGEHPVADDLRALGIDTTGIASVYMPDRKAIIMPPTVIGTAVRRHEGYPGTEDEHGRMVISHAPGVDVLTPPTFPLQPPASRAA